MKPDWFFTIEKKKMLFCRDAYSVCVCGVGGGGRMYCSTNKADSVQFVNECTVK